MVKYDTDPNMVNTSGNTIVTFSFEHSINGRPYTSKRGQGIVCVRSKGRMCVRLKIINTKKSGK